MVGWLGYRAIRESERNATRLAERTAQEAANLLADALTRDMHAVQTAVLPSQDWDEFMPDRSYVVSQLVASAFARYPYPESFFAWRRRNAEAPVVFFSRADRPPAWISVHQRDYASPVLITTEPATGRQLINRISRDALLGRRFSMFDIRLENARYQVVAGLRYDNPYRERLDAVFGFTVNMAWVREKYFTDVTREIARIAGSDSGLVLTILDEAGTLRAASGPDASDGVAGRRQFSLLFFDPLSLSPVPPSDLVHERWTGQALVFPDRSLSAVGVGARTTLIVAVLAALLLGIGLALTARAMRENANLAEMRSAFVSTVTHELKTPIATIRAAGDTLASGRVASPEALREYARLVVDEAKRLTRLLNNLLAYARITDVTEAYSFQSTDLRRIVSESLREFRSRLESANYQVQIDIQPELPPVRGDATALGLMFDNILDNAIRYSKDNHAININATADEGIVTLNVADRGIGIPQSEIEHVTRKFFRGRNASSEGSGLGLAITERIVRDHGGSLHIQSTVGVGTTVSLRFPVAEGIYETTDSRR